MSTLLPEQPPHPPQDTIFLRIIRVILARNLQKRRKRFRICFDLMPYPLRNLPTSTSSALPSLRTTPRRRNTTYMLIDEQDGYIFAVTGVAVEGGFDGRVLRFGIDDEEVLLGIRWLGDVLSFGQSAIA